MVCILLKSFYQFHYCMYQQDILIFHNIFIDFSSSQMISNSGLQDMLTYQLVLKYCNSILTHKIYNMIDLSDRYKYHEGIDIINQILLVHSTL
jgi:hypothetical protein